MCKLCERKSFVARIKQKSKIQYVRDYDGRPNGVLIAFPLEAEEGKIAIGYSLCNLDKGDTFDKEIGIEIAADRALKWSNKFKVKNMYYVDSYDVRDFLVRMKKYYKDKKFPVWAENFLKENEIYCEGDYK